MANTALRAGMKSSSPGQKANSGCQLAEFWVTGGTNSQGFGSVAPKSSKGITVFSGSDKR